MAAVIPSPLSSRPHQVDANKSNTHLEHLSKLNIYVEPDNYRKSGTQGFGVPCFSHFVKAIICTIGPKTNSVEMLTKLRDAGMGVVRMNFSHGSYEFHGSIIKNTREVEKTDPDRVIAIALDTKGPEIRTGRSPLFPSELARLSLSELYCLLFYFLLCPLKPMLLPMFFCNA